MSKLADPGIGLPRQAAQQARIALWRRSAKIADRQAKKDERIADWRARYDTDSTKKRTS